MLSGQPRHTPLHHCYAMPLLVSQPFLGWLLVSWLVSFPPGFNWRSQLSNIFASSVCPACTPALRCTLHKECVLTLAWSHLVGLLDWRGFCVWHLCTVPSIASAHLCMARGYCPEPLSALHMFPVGLCVLYWLLALLAFTDFTVPGGLFTALHFGATFYSYPRAYTCPAPWDC